MAIRRTPSGRWAVDYYVGARRVVKVIGSKKEAEAVWAKVRAALLAGQYGLAVAIKPRPLGELAKCYLDSISHTRGLSTEVIHVKTAVAYFEQGTPVHAIGREEIDRYFAHRRTAPSRNGGGPRSPVSANREVQALSRMLSAAVRWGWIHENPCRGFSYAEEPSGRDRVLTRREVSSLLSSCRGDLTDIVMAALLTGMRRGEVLGLRWTEIDWSNRLICLPKGRTKTGRARKIPIGESLYEILTAHGRAQSFGWGGAKTSEYVFPHRNFRRQWAAAVKRAGLGDFHFHDLRHTAISHMVMAGVPMRTVGEIVGHSTAWMTEKYSHLLPEHLHRAVGTLEEVFNGKADAGEPDRDLCLPAPRDAGRDREAEGGREPDPVQHG